jgi:hypothetical protein
MRNNLPQPYWSHVLSRFPKDQRLLEAAAGYLEMRIGKNPELSINDWDSCLDDVLNVYEIADSTQSRVRKISKKSTITIPELTYLFLTATARKWNHIVFTSEQDKMYANMSYYQDPYWNDIKNNPETLAILREELGSNEQ